MCTYLCCVVCAAIPIQMPSNLSPVALCQWLDSRPPNTTPARQPLGELLILRSKFLIDFCRPNQITWVVRRLDMQNETPHRNDRSRHKKTEPLLPPKKETKKKKNCRPSIVYFVLLRGLFLPLFDCRLAWGQNENSISISSCLDTIFGRSHTRWSLVDAYQFAWFISISFSFFFFFRHFQIFLPLNQKLAPNNIFLFPKL